MWELDHNESWELKNWCFGTLLLEKTLESPLDCKEIQPVDPLGNQPWIFIGRTGAEAEAPIIWPLGAKNWLTGKTLMLEKIEGRRRRGDRGWDGWMASPTRWTWIWVDSGSWWRTGKPGCAAVHGVSKSCDMTEKLNNNNKVVEFCLFHWYVPTPRTVPGVQ